MRILLAQNSTYYPAHGGGDRSNRLLLEGLAEGGHTCQVVARAQASLGEKEHDEYLQALAQRSVRDIYSEPGAVRFPLNGVDVHVVTSHPNLRAYVAQQIKAFTPGVILVSTDDPAQLFVEIALQSPVSRVIYLTRTTLALPFGPECAIPSEEKTQRLRQADGVVAVSNYVANYIRTWSGIAAQALPISPLEPGPYPELGSIDNEFVLMVNPCAVKGISIFLALADRMSDVMFAAVPTWGTTREDLAALLARGNVRILEPADKIDAIFRMTRVLLMPSLWAEARGRIVVEALLRGIPVLASNIGGIPEAKLGVDYLLPVRPIVHYRHQLDEQMVPVAVVPEQEVGPWEAALVEVLSSRERYERLARQSRTAALAYATSLSITPFEDYLKNVAASPINPLRGGGKSVDIEPHSTAFQKLSPEKLALLAARMKKRPAERARGNVWFPMLREDTRTRLRLFCFPYAGGGASAFLGWAGKLPADVDVCPARLPGRENRASEPPFDHIEGLVEALALAMRSHLDWPYALFGHSMGAMIAFELARYLRAHGLPAPRLLVAAAARAPHLRAGHRPPPEPSEEEFLSELRHLEGAAKELLDNDELLKVVLPALRADAALCRVYSYEPERPLDCPIVAYAGASDSRLPPGVIDPWRKQTTARFTMHVVPGGHFFAHPSNHEFFSSISGHLNAVY